MCVQKRRKSFSLLTLQSGADISWEALQAKTCSHERKHFRKKIRLQANTFNFTFWTLSGGQLTAEVVQCADESQRYGHNESNQRPQNQGATAIWSKHTTYSQVSQRIALCYYMVTSFSTTTNNSLSALNYKIRLPDYSTYSQQRKGVTHHKGKIRKQHHTSHAPSQT